MGDRDLDVHPELIVEFGDAAGLRAAGTKLTTATSTIKTTANSCSTKWATLGAHYHAPESATMLSAIKPGESDAGLIHTDAGTVKSALDALATEIDSLNTRKAKVVTDKATLQSEVNAVDEGGWDLGLFSIGKTAWRDKRPDLRDRETALKNEVESIKADWETAQKTCADALTSQFKNVTKRPGKHLPQTPPEPPAPPAAPKPPEPKGWGPFPPWPDDPIGSLKNAASSTWQGVKSVAGGFKDGFTEMKDGFMDMTGLHGMDKMKATWGGMVTLGKTALTAVNPLADPADRAQAQAMMREVGKALIDLDTWRTDPARAFGKTLFNLTSLAVGSGAGGLLKGATAAAKASSTLQKASLASKAINIANKATDLVASSRAANTVRNAATRVAGSRAAQIVNSTARTIGESKVVRAVNDFPPVRTVKSVNTVVHQRLEDAGASATRRILGDAGDGAVRRSSTSTARTTVSRASTTDVPHTSEPSTGAPKASTTHTSEPAAHKSSSSSATPATGTRSAASHTGASTSAPKVSASHTSEPTTAPKTTASHTSEPTTAPKTTHEGADVSRPRQGASSTQTDAAQTGSRAAGTAEAPRTESTRTAATSTDGSAKPVDNATSSGQRSAAHVSGGEPEPTRASQRAAVTNGDGADHSKPVAEPANQRAAQPTHTDDTSAPKPNQRGTEDVVADDTNRPAEHEAAQRADDAAAGRTTVDQDGSQRAPEQPTPETQGVKAAGVADETVNGRPGQVPVDTDTPTAAHTPDAEHTPDAGHTPEGDHTPDAEHTEHPSEHAQDVDDATAHPDTDPTHADDVAPEADAADTTPHEPVDHTVNNLTPEQLDAIHADSIDVPGGKAFYDGDPDTAAAAKQLEAIPGHYTVDVHGGPDGVYIGDQKLTAKDLADLIRKDPNYDGRRVFLMSCETGQGHPSLASGLARELDAPVTAPDTLAWSGPDGKAWAANPTPDGSSTFPPDGTFHDHHPDGTREVSPLHVQELVDGNPNTHGFGEGVDPSHADEARARSAATVETDHHPDQHSDTEQHPETDHGDADTGSDDPDAHSTPDGVVHPDGDVADTTPDAHHGTEAGDQSPTADAKGQIDAEAAKGRHPDFHQEFVPGADGHLHHPDDPVGTRRRSDGVLINNAGKTVTDDAWAKYKVDNPHILDKPIDHHAAPGPRQEIDAGLDLEKAKQEAAQILADNPKAGIEAPEKGLDHSSLPTPQQALTDRCVADLRSQAAMKQLKTSLGEFQTKHPQLGVSRDDLTSTRGMDALREKIEAGGLSPRELKDVTRLLGNADTALKARVQLQNTSEVLGLATAKHAATADGVDIVAGTGGPGAGSGRLDMIATKVVTDPQTGAEKLIVRIYEAKGGSGSLDGRDLPNGKRAEQGSPEYLQDVMPRDPEMQRLLDEHPLAKSGAVQVEYFEVSATARGTASERIFDLTPRAK